MQKLWEIMIEEGELFHLYQGWSISRSSCMVSELNLDSHIWLIVSKWNLQVAIFHWQKFTEKIWEIHPKYSWKSRFAKFPRCFITFTVWLAFICLISHSHESHIYLCKKYFSRIWNNFFLLKFLFSLSPHPSRDALNNITGMSVSEVKSK